MVVRSPIAATAHTSFSANGNKHREVWTSCNRSNLPVHGKSRAAYAGTVGVSCARRVVRRQVGGILYSRPVRVVSRGEEQESRGTAAAVDV